MLIGSDEAEIRVQMYNSIHLFSALKIPSLFGVCLDMATKVCCAFLYNFKNVSSADSLYSPDSVRNHNFKGNKMVTISSNFISFLSYAYKKIASFYFTFFQEIIEIFFPVTSFLFFLWPKIKMRYCLKELLNKIKIWYISKDVNKYWYFITGLEFDKFRIWSYGI